MVMIMKTLDISGDWKVRTAKDGPWNHTLFHLPGSACENKIGIPQDSEQAFSAESVRTPREKYEFVGPLWLQKEISIPEEFSAKSLRLFLERVNLSSRLWVDETEIGRQTIGLSTPHIYDLTGLLCPGPHQFLLEIDNRNLVRIDEMASGYSMDTQGLWNGIIGRIELQSRELYHIEQADIYPDETGIQVRTVLTSDACKPTDRKRASIRLKVETPNGDILPTKQLDLTLFQSSQVEYFRYPISSIKWWNEFHPDLYTLHLEYHCLETDDSCADEMDITFGMRTISSEGQKILLNHAPIALRGTTNCAIFPLTGYPDMSLSYWMDIFRTIQDYGLNYVRFHSFCPPENAFAAADKLGIYLSVEMPLWLNQDVCALEFGEDPIHECYYSLEAKRISRTYGNHPSFLLFSNGNETMGDTSLLEEILMQTKALDPRRLYALTSNFDHPVLPCEEYFCASEAGGEKLRNENLLFDTAESSSITFDAAVSAVKIPVISFETGQYCVFPDVRVIPSYTGSILPVNFLTIRKEMERRGLYDRVPDYVHSSGTLAALLYKEEIEAALRTKNLSGFALLSLSDYTGQNTATIGLLDAFWKSKGILSAEEFRHFCSPVVPLFMAKRIFINKEHLIAKLDLYDHGETPLTDPIFHLELSIHKETIYATDICEKSIDLPLNFIQDPSMVRVSLSVESYQNCWTIFVYPDPSKIKDQTPTVIQDSAALRQIIRDGGSALVDLSFLREPLSGSFFPPFWSPAFFPDARPCGAMIQEEHPIFRQFPTGPYSDYQWESLLEGCYCIDFTDLKTLLSPIVEFVPNFMNLTLSSPLFEAQIGNAKLLFCGFDLTKKDPATVQFRKSLCDYLCGPDFSPQERLDEQSLLSMFV